MVGFQAGMQMLEPALLLGIIQRTKRWSRYQRAWSGLLYRDMMDREVYNAFYNSGLTANGQGWSRITTSVGYLLAAITGIAQTGYGFQSQSRL